MQAALVRDPLVPVGALQGGQVRILDPHGEEAAGEQRKQAPRILVGGHDRLELLPAAPGRTRALIVEQRRLKEQLLSLRWAPEGPRVRDGSGHQPAEHKVAR